MMTKVLPFAFASLLAFPLIAQEPVTEIEQAPLAQEAASQPDYVVWPAYFAICQWPRTQDVVGLRLTIPFSTSQDNVTGFDLGFWGKSLYFEGFQLNVLRNNAVDSMSGVQIGLYNSTGNGEMLGLQVGLWNEAMNFTGVQAGLINVVGTGYGFQFGLINRAESMQGYQVGLINVIRDAECPFMPVINIGF